jgi:hypothetical protein
VCGHGGALLVDELADVDGGRDLGLGRPEILHLGGIGHVHTLRELGAPISQEPGDVVAVGCGLEHDRRLRQLGCSYAHPVYLDVVGVSVGAVVVVDGQRVGGLFAQDARQPCRRLVDVRRPERLRGVVRWLAHHPRVEVAEELHSGDPEDLGGAVGLGHPAPRERLVGLEHALRDLAVVASGRDDEHDAMTVGGRACHDAGGGDRLVIGVGVEGHEGVWHEGSSSRPHGRDAAQGLAPRPADG